MSGNKNVVLLVTSWGANWELGMHFRTHYQKKEAQKIVPHSHKTQKRNTKHF
jgi:hypothetical protein